MSHLATQRCSAGRTWWLAEVLLVLGAIILLAFGCAETPKPTAAPATLAEAQTLAAKLGKPVLIDFFAVL